MLDKLPMLRNIPYAETRSEAERLRRVFTRWCGDHSYDAAREAIERDWERMVTFYLRLPQKALASPSYDQPGRVAVRGAEA